MLAIFVLDCADPELLAQFRAAGEMPRLNQLAQRGAQVNLRSDALFLDGGVVQTLLTGANPARHGSYKFRQLVPGTYRYEWVEMRTKPMDQVWTELSARGLECCVFDVPKAFPAEGLNGRLVASWGAYSPAGPPASSPAELIDEVHRRFGRHPFRMFRRMDQPTAGYRRALARLLEGARLRGDILCWLLERECDFLMTTFSETHTGGHQFWHVYDATHPLANPEIAEEQPLEQIYAAVDHSLGRALDALPDDATVVVMTQQGFMMLFVGNTTLSKWLARRQGVPAGRFSELKQTAWKALGKPGNRCRDFLVDLAPHARWKQSLVNWWVSREFTPKTDVFMLAGSDYNAMLRVNLQGREPQGTVAPQDYRRTMEELKGELLELTDMDTSRPVVRDVLLLHDVYEGEFVEDLPDMIVLWTNEAPIRGLVCPRLGLIEGNTPINYQKLSGHHGEGWAVIAGPQIAPGEVPGAFTLQDMNATWYELLGKRRPEYCEGTPIPLTAAARHDHAVPPRP